MSLKRKSVGSAVRSLRFRPFQMCSQQESAVGSGARRNRFVRIQSNSHQSVVSIQSNSEPEQALGPGSRPGARSENQERYQDVATRLFKTKKKGRQRKMYTFVSFTPRSQRPEPRARLHPTRDPVSPRPALRWACRGRDFGKVFFLGFLAVSFLLTFFLAML